MLRGYSLVVVTDCTLAEAARINAFCRAHDIKFITGDVRGIFAWSFVDVGAQHDVTDADGEAVNEIRVAEVAVNDAAAGTFAFATLDGEPHELQERDCVAFHDLASSTSLECIVTAVLKARGRAVSAQIACSL